MEGVHQIPNGALAHPDIAVYDVFAMSKREEGREKSGGGTSVANEKFSFAVRDPASEACHRHRVIGFVESNRKAKGLEGLCKILRVI
jgi:hypothetical protein